MELHGLINKARRSAYSNASVSVPIRLWPLILTFFKILSHPLHFVEQSNRINQFIHELFDSRKVNYRVIDTGGWIAIAYSDSEGMSFIVDVTSYDPETGVGIGEANGESHGFRITGEPGNMTLHLSDT